MSDWSKTGIGFVVLQQQCSCSSNVPPCCANGWALVLCGSRRLTPSEKNYAPIEGEALALTLGLMKAKMLLYGRPKFVIITDHKPLVSIFSDKSLASIENPRLFRMKEKSLQFSFEIQHIPGKKMLAADALSRYPVSRPTAEDEDFSSDIDQSVITKIATSIVSSHDVISTTLDNIKDAARCDPCHQLLIEKVTKK